MITQVKICGLKTPDAIDAAIAGGADYVGLVFFPPSPRNISISHARDLAYHIAGRTKIVTLMVDPDDALIKEVAREVKPDLIQLHGSETPGRAAEIRKLAGTGIMKVIKVETAKDADQAFAFSGIADLILFDAKAPKGAELPGGNGLAFDWRVLADLKGKLNYMLAGGLTPENVAEAIALTGASAVDVSSGVESAPGVKDIARIRAFLLAAKS